MNNLGIDLKEWESVEAKEFGEYESLELGGHEVVIMDARLYESPITHNVSLKVCVDIAGNDKQKGYFKKQYDENTSNDKKWPTSATRYLSLKSENLAYIKGFVTALENSNKNFKFDTSKGWDQINNLKTAGVFGLEEYQDDKGVKKVATKLVQFRSLDKLKDIKIPSVKLLDGSFVSYEEYKNTPQNNNTTTTDDSVEITAEDLPF